jgi:hypothetical protein
MISEIFCEAPDDVGELLLAEAGLATVCVCDDDCLQEDDGAPGAWVAELSAVASGLRRGVLLRGVPERRAVHIQTAKVQALEHLMATYEAEGDGAGIELCRVELQELGRSTPRILEGGRVVARAPQLPTRFSSGCCSDLEFGSPGWGLSSSGFASLSLATMDGVIQVSTTAPLVLPGPRPDAWADLVLEEGRRRSDLELIAGLRWHRTVVGMTSSATSETPDNLHDATAKEPVQLYTCPELADLIEQHIAAVERGEEPPNVSEMQVTFTPVADTPVDSVAS